MFQDFKKMMYGIAWNDTIGSSHHGSMMLLDSTVLFPVEIPQSYTFPLIYVATCVRMLREATSISEVSPSSDTCDNTLKNLGRRARNSHDGSTRGALGLHGVFPCSYSLTKQNKLKRSTGQPSLEGSQRDRPREPTWLEFWYTQSLRGVGIPPKLSLSP
jgi:hypothetical protein